MSRRWTAVAAATLIALPTAAAAQADTAQTRPPARIAEARATLMNIPSETVDFMVGGQVVSSLGGAPVIGAQVYLLGTTIGTLTDHHGRFRLDAPAGTSVRLGVRLIGYQEVCVDIELAEHRMVSLGIVLPPHNFTFPPAEPRSGCIEPEVVEPPRR